MLSTLWWALGLLAFVNGQTVSQWNDPVTGTSFWRYYQDDIDATWGYIFPPLNAGQAPDDFIGIFQAPADAGYMGNSLGGAMRSNLLLVAWTDEVTPKISSRWANEYAPPAIYTGPRLTILGSSGNNGVLQRIVYRCQNCTTWTGGTGGISPNGTQVFGFAYHITTKPLDPSDSNSGLYRHSHVGQYGLDVGGARTAQYNTYLQQLISAPPYGAPTTTVLPPTPTVPPPTTTVSPPLATQSLYGQCAGSGWSGPTLCPANSVCRSFNRWFSQCIPG